MKYNMFKDARKQQGISIWRMSKKLRMNPIKYWFLEQHIKRMELKDYLRISEILGISYEVIR